MKRSHVFLTSATKDKAGEVREIEYEDGPNEFLEPVSYAANDDLGKLRHDVLVARTALAHAKARGAKPAEIAKLQKALATAAAAVDKLHIDQKQERQRHQTGGDSPFGPRPTGDTRMFMEPVSYADHDTDTDSSGRTFDDEADDELEAAIRKAVDDLETAQAKGASPAKMEKLAKALKVLRDQLPNPSAPPAETSVAPPHMNREPGPGAGADTGAIRAPFPGAKKLPDDGPAWKASRSAAAPAAKKAGWDKFLADLDDRLAKRALAASYPGAASPIGQNTAKNALALNWNTFLRDPSLRPV